MELKVVQIEKPEDSTLSWGNRISSRRSRTCTRRSCRPCPASNLGWRSARRPAWRWCAPAAPIRHSSSWRRKTRWRLRRVTRSSSFWARLFPVNVLNQVKLVPEVCHVFCATANPAQVILAETEQGRGILGVIDGDKTKGFEDESGVAWRMGFLRKIGYKLGG